MSFNRKTAGVAVLGTACIVLVSALYEPALEQWYLRGLNSADARVRLSAAARLGSLQSRRAVPALIDAYRREIKNPPPFLLQIYVDTFRRIGSPAVPLLLHSLEDRDKEVRTLAAWALREIAPDKNAIPALTARLRSTDEDSVAWSAEILGAIGQPAVPVLVEALKYENEFVQFCAALSLCNLNPPVEEAAPVLVKTIVDKHGNLRLRGLPVLGNVLDETRDIQVIINTANVLYRYALGPESAVHLSRLTGIAEGDVELLRTELLRYVKGLDELCGGERVDAAVSRRDPASDAGTGR